MKENAAGHGEMGSITTIGQQCLVGISDVTEGGGARQHDTGLHSEKLIFNLLWISSIHFLASRLKAEMGVRKLRVVAGLALFRVCSLGGKESQSSFSTQNRKCTEAAS